MKEDDDGMFLTEDRMSIGLNSWKTPTSHPLNSSQSHKSCPQVLVCLPPPDIW